ncbi:hypothetical protein [Natrinema sp. 1APR25-10V2]|uniref:hypothetical protein n=1 Tax=Natrinema sp. 1APR25-10V2 TaxID=2951081 RepID=UPI00287B676D|nr:hypothetical protein [Natrinema sp. 1APR25-10V2]
MTRNPVDPFTFEPEDNADWSHGDTQSIEVALADGVKRRQPRIEPGISAWLRTDSCPVFVGPSPGTGDHQEEAQPLEARGIHAIECPAAARLTV